MNQNKKVVKFKLGKLIRELRMAKGWTLEYLCSGDEFNEINGMICDPSELGKYERGERRPNWTTFEKLMQRLGEDPISHYKGYSLTAKDREFAEKKNKLKILTRDNKIENTIEVESMVFHLEQNEFFIRDKFNRQFLLSIKAILAFHQKNYQKMYDFAYEGIKITKLNFNEDKIDTYALFFVEIQLILQIATAHTFITSLAKSTDILFNLKKCMDNGYVDEEEKSKTYMRVLFNLSNKLGQLKRYDECYSICEVGIEFCEKYQNSHLIPMLLFNKGCCLLGLGKRKEGIAILIDAYALFKAFKRNTELFMIEAYVEAEFNVKITND
ncbi:MAG: helix-turn-helix domain-containing protein [Defluviitaleaceae bacterium]|nr:helix-turn-helix domain-containing protein [Defluviitaleaceae bacterium]